MLGMLRKQGRSGGTTPGALVLPLHDELWLCLSSSAEVRSHADSAPSLQGEEATTRPGFTYSMVDGAGSGLEFSRQRELSWKQNALPAATQVV